VSTTLRFTALSLSEFGVCALGTDAAPYCRADDGAMVSANPGVPLRSLSSGPVHHCGIRHDGITVCWGSNSSGQLGVGDLVGRGLPVPVVGQ
jgi:alpha-tubulin suppressor-like RCC1 family protein